MSPPSIVFRLSWVVGLLSSSLTEFLSICKAETFSSFSASFFISSSAIVILLFLRNAQFCTATSRIVHLFLIIRQYHLAHHFQWGVDTSVEVLVNLSLHIARLHHVLHDSIFERVIGDHRQSAVLAQALHRRTKHISQCVHLVVHLYSQCLEQLCHVFLGSLPRHHRFHHLHKVARGDEFLCGALPYYCRRYT